MTEREKIVEIVLDTEITGIKLRNITGGISTANAIADALIEAGYGDVKSLVDGNGVLCVKDKGFMRLYPEWDIKELEHRAAPAEYRAEVYERALYHTAISDTEYQEAIEQAQKELAEEKKQ